MSFAGCEEPSAVLIRRIASGRCARVFLGVQFQPHRRQHPDGRSRLRDGETRIGLRLSDRERAAASRIIGMRANALAAQW